jgi:uncharacterized membrane protein
MTTRSDEVAARDDDKAQRNDDTTQRDDDTTRKMELAISLVLRIGVSVSVAVIAAGLALMFVHHAAYGHVSGSFSYHRLTSRSTQFPHTFPQLGAALEAGQGRGVVVVGILILILTPVLRVAVSVVSFFYERDRAMTLVTLFVLAALVGSFFLGGVMW